MNSNPLDISMKEEKKGKWKPLNAKQKLMIIKNKWEELGFTQKQIKKMEGARFRGLISEEITKTRMESKDFF